MFGKVANARKMITFDCRYPFEYSGGHAPHALNTPSPYELWDLIFEKEKSGLVPKIDKDTIIVFHCEYSQKRAPKMCQFLRDCDRNSNKWPGLHYPNAYVLNRGYKFFFHFIKRLLQCHHLLKAPAQPMEDCIMVSEELQKGADHLEKHLKTENFVEHISELEKLGIDLGDKSSLLVQELMHLTYVPMDLSHFDEECRKQSSEADTKWLKKKMEMDKKKRLQKSMSCNCMLGTKSKKEAPLRPKFGFGTGSTYLLPTIALLQTDDRNEQENQVMKKHSSLRSFFSPKFPGFEDENKIVCENVPTFNNSLSFPISADFSMPDLSITNVEESNAMEMDSPSPFQQKGPAAEETNAVEDFMRIQSSLRATNAKKKRTKRPGYEPY